MPENEITSETRKDMKPRGRGKRSMILEAMRKKAMLGLGEESTPEQAEMAWFEHLIDNSLDSENKDSGLCLRLITERGWAALKPSSDCVSFEFDPSAPPHDQASQVMNAVSEGQIPPDLGLAFVGGIKSMVEVEVNTNLKARIEQLEEMINAQSQ